MLLLPPPTSITVCHEIHDSSNDPASAVPRLERTARLFVNSYPRATIIDGSLHHRNEGLVEKAWILIKSTVLSFIEDDALSKGAAIAFYTATSIAPILLIVVAVAGLAFGTEAAQNGIVGQLTGLIGKESAEFLQSAIANAQNKSAGTLATLIGVVTIIVTASGVFGEMQSALNAIWKIDSSGTPISRLIRARAASLGLVVSLGFLMMVSLVVSAGLTALGDYLNAVLPFGKIVLTILNGIVSVLLISVLFAAIYKVLPDRPIQWRDVVVGSAATALLFTGGKSLIGWYIGSSAVASTYGAAGALIVILLWVYYSAQIFLLGAEFTKAYSDFRTGKPREVQEIRQVDRLEGPKT
jgi:membrane protein